MQSKSVRTGYASFSRFHELTSSIRRHSSVCIHRFGDDYLYKFPFDLYWSIVDVCIDDNIVETVQNPAGVLLLFSVPRWSLLAQNEPYTPALDHSHTWQI